MTAMQNFSARLSPSFNILCGGNASCEYRVPSEGKVKKLKLLLTVRGTPKSATRNSVHGTRYYFSKSTVFHRQIPVAVENLEPALLFPLKRLLVGIHLLLQPCFVEGLVGYTGIFKGRWSRDNPSARLPWCDSAADHPDFRDPSHLHFFL